MQPTKPVSVTQKFIGGMLFYIYEKHGSFGFIKIYPGNSAYIARMHYTAWRH